MKTLITLIIFLVVSQSGFSQNLVKLLESHVTFLASDSLDGRGLGTDGKVRAKRYIADHFEKFGLLSLGESYFQHFRVRANLAWVDGYNVIGYLKGSDPELKNEIIVIGAHYDHVGYELKKGKRVLYPGADDNASGTATIIELARYFSENPQKTKRSILFIAFDAEESGLLGAYHFTENLDDDLKNKIKAMFSLDMVGMYTVYKGLDLKGIATIAGGKELAKEVAEKHDVKLKNISSNIEMRTDTWPFGKIDIPAVHAFTGTVSPYHKPGDFANLIEYEGMGKVSLYLRDLISELSSKSQIMPSSSFLVRNNPFKVKYGVILHAGSSNHIYTKKFYDANSVFAFSSGLFLQIPINKSFLIQPELLYDFNGSKSALGTIRRHSITIPINLNYNFSVQYDGMFRSFISSGTYYRYTFSGKTGKTDMNFDSVYNQTEWGLGFGAGIELMGVQVGYTYRRALNTLTKTPMEPNYDNGSYFTVGYHF